MKKWNNVYKRWECKFCDEAIELTEKHVCKKSLPTIYDVTWNNLTDKQKEGFRKAYNNDEIAYNKYETVSHYAYDFLNNVIN